MRPDEEAVVITLRDVYNEVVSVKGSVQSMNGLPLQVGDHETRIRALEKWRYALPPTLVISIGSMLVALLRGNHG